MENHDSEHQRLARTAREVGAVLRRQARRRWETVRTASRDEGNRHVWRFREGTGGSARYLHVSHDALADGDAPALLKQLRAGRIFARLSGTERSLLLSRGGRLEPYPAN